MRIAVLGAGSLGSVIGGALTRGGGDVTVVSRNPAYVEAVNERGLSLIEDGETTIVWPRATSCVRDVGTVDLLIVLVKSFDTRQALSDAAPLIGAATIVLTLQNGLGNEEVVAAAVGAARVVSGRTYVGGDAVAPGVVVAGIRGRATVIGELTASRTARIEAVADEFRRAGLVTEVSDDIHKVIWRKLLVNVATGALAGVTGLAYGPLYRLDGMREVAAMAVGEAVAVAAASGVDLEPVDPAEVWASARDGLPASFRTSMLQSLDRGTPSEVEAINGSVVAAGKRLGVATPVNSTLVALVTARESTSRPTASKSDMKVPGRIDHVALFVADLADALDTYTSVFDMTETAESFRDESLGAPHQVWMSGGIQLIEPHGPGVQAGRLAHIAIAVTDKRKVGQALETRGAHQSDRGPDWWTLPDGLVIELVEAQFGDLDIGIQPTP